jgi:choline dehydrogenase-like flavoprotein
VTTRGPLAALACAACLLLARATPGASADSLRAVFFAVFDTWFPIDSLPVDESVRSRGPATRDALWRQVAASADLRADLATIRQRSGGAVRFEQRSLSDRESLLVALMRADRNQDRRASMRLRNACLTGVYSSPLGRRIAGLDPAPDAAPPGATPEPPHIPPTWLAYEASARRLVAREGRIDDLIVGSGPSGSVLAYELQRAGHRVLMLEQGSFVIPGAMNTRALPALLESGGRRASVSGSVLFNNAEVVGGGTTVNIDLVFSPDHESTRHQIDSWRRAGRIAPHQYEPDSLEVADDWVKTRLLTRAPSSAEINANNRVLWDGATREGLHPALYELNTYPPNAWPTPYSDKRSSVSGLLLQAIQSRQRPLALLPDARVTRVLIDAPNRARGDRVARGVEFVVRAPWNSPGVLADPLHLGLRSGDTLRVEADRVILCAGTLGSATILLRSKLDDPDIGRGIVAHPAVPVIGRFADAIDAQRGTPATVYVDDLAIPRRCIFEAMSAPPQYAALMTAGSGRLIYDVVAHYRNLAGFGAMLIDEPSPDNRITLDAAGNPEIRYELSASDRARLGFAVEEGARMMFRAGAIEVLVPSYELAGGIASPRGDGCVFTDSSQVRGLAGRLRFVPNCTLVTSAHLQSSDKMGSRPTGSVVGTDHQVWGVRGLYVADTSVFPSSVGANPMQSAYVFAKLFADELLRKP